MNRRTRAALVLALLAGSFSAAPAHATTTVTAQLWLDASSTCVVVSCDVTVSVSYCIERFAGTVLCTADPATVRMIGVSDATGGCLLRVAAAQQFVPLVMHTQALGDLVFEPFAVTIVAGQITFTATTLDLLTPAAVVGAGFVEGQIFPPVSACEFTHAILYGAFTAVGV
jgi:hypothetical protein